jgi:hypothetical protein
MESVIDDFVTQGYTILNRGESSALLRKNSWGSGGGHLLWALLTVWFTLELADQTHQLEVQARATPLPACASSWSENAAAVFVR